MTKKQIGDIKRKAIDQTHLTAIDCRGELFVQIQRHLYSAPVRRAALPVAADALSRLRVALHFFHSGYVGHLPPLSQGQFLGKSRLSRARTTGDESEIINKARIRQFYCDPKNLLNLYQ